MKLAAGILTGVLLTLAVLAGVGYFSVTSGAIGWKADEAPGEFETWAAKTSLRASLKEERNRPSPIASTDANIMEGAKLYMANCAFCHGTPTMGEAKPGSALYQGAPQFGLGDTVSDDPVGKIHAIIAHGIRLTGMPAYDKYMKDEDLWKLALFLKAKDNLPPDVKKYWQTTDQLLLPSSRTTSGGGGP